jgi:predicted MPP superfamily phosphohydrolase
MLAVWLSPIYLLVNAYLLIRIFQWLGACHGALHDRKFQITFGLIYLFFALTPLTAYLSGQGMLHRILKILNNDWMGILLYMIMIIASADILRFFLKKTSLRKVSWFRSGRFFVVNGGICMALILSLVTFGILHPKVIKTNDYQVKIAKSCGEIKEMKIVLIADLHVGYSVDLRHVKQMVRKINRQHPDLVVFAGDFYDNSYEAIQNPQKTAMYLNQIESRYGVYGCLGNHDLEEDILAGFTFSKEGELEENEKMISYIEKDCGIHLLKEEAVLIQNDFYLIGREDPARARKLGEERKSPKELLAKCDPKKPIFVLDHQPKEYDLLNKAGADLDLSGHTHDGQMFPINLLMKFIWENPSGYQKIGNMHTVVTSGVGIWGPAMRVGTDSEIAVITVKFE